MVLGVLTKVGPVEEVVVEVEEGAQVLVVNSTAAFGLNVKLREPCCWNSLEKGNIDLMNNPYL